MKPTNELVQIQELKKYTELLELEKRQLAEENSKHKLELESRRRLDRKDLGIDFSRSSHKQPWGSTTTLTNEHLEEHSVDIHENSVETSERESTIEREIPEHEIPLQQSKTNNTSHPI